MIIEKDGTLKYKDKEGNIQKLYPSTKRENLLGMEEIDDHLVSKKNPHKTTAEQVGAVATSDIATVSEARTYIGF